MSDLVEHPQATPNRGATPLQISVRSEGAALVIAIAGEIDMSTVPALRACLERNAHDAGGTVVIDLAGITFMDSTGLNQIVQTHRALEGSDRRLVLRNPGRAVQRAVAISGIDRFVEVQHGQAPG